MRLAPLLLLACNDDYLLPSGGGGGGDTERVDAILALTGDADAGGTLFDDDCAICHDATGESDSVGPALKPWMQTAADADTVGIMIGGQGSMPAQDLTDQEAADVLAWLKATFGGGGQSTGAALFDDHCVVCHAADGAAKVGPGLATVVPNRTAQQLSNVISNGTGSMPGFSNQMTIDEIDTLVGWLMEQWPSN